MSIKVIAEIGINHKGQLSRAKEIIDIAKRSGAWGIKFQYRDPSDFYASKNQIGDEILSKEINKSNLNIIDITSCAIYCKKLKLNVGISFFRTKDLIKSNRYIKNFDFIKIPSSEFNNEELINKAIKTKRKCGTDQLVIYAAKNARTQGKEFHQVLQA